MIVRNTLYLWTVVPANFWAGLAIFTLVLLWSAMRKEQERSS